MPPTDEKLAIEAARMSVMQVGMHIVDKKRFAYRVLGTGIVVDDRHIITAKHVTDAVHDLLKQGPHVRPTLSFAGENHESAAVTVMNTFAAHECRLRAVDEPNDLALLWSTVPLAAYGGSVLGRPVRTPQPIRMSLARPDEGEHVACSGYPLGEESLVTTRGTIASAWSGHTSNHKRIDRFLGDFTANPGNSGGPVYRIADGALIGVLVAGKLAPVVDETGHASGASHAAGLSVIVPARAVARLMEQCDLAPLV